MRDNIFRGKMYLISFHSVKGKGNWTHIAQKISQPGAKVNAICRLY